MVRTVKAKAVRSPGKGERVVLMPGATEAEPWEVWLLGAPSAAECLQACSSPADNRLRKNATLALPVAQVFCLPLWLNETDSKQISAMIPLQLELHGLQPRGVGAAVSDWSVVEKDGARTLVVVGVLPAALAKEVDDEAYGTFDLSARYLSLPENALTLWQEQDRLVVAITRGQNLVYFQALAENKITDRVLQDLNCIRTTLLMQGVVTTLQQVMLWKEVSPAEFSALRNAMQLPVNQAECPPPRAPSTSWKLTPTTVHEAKRKRESKRWQGRAALVVLAIYLVLVAVLAIRFFIASQHVKELQQWQAEHAQDIALVHDTAAAWKDLRPVVDENSYPLELLLHTYESIPADQLRLTLFEAENGHLRIKGEAKNVTAAFQFLDNLKKNPNLTGYTWDMGQPQILPNDLAQFQVEGTRL